MLVKTLIMPLSLLITIVFSGCSWCEKEVFVERKVPYEVLVPQKCIVPEPLGCKWDNVEDYEVSVKLMECIVELKENAKKCK